MAVRQQRWAKTTRRSIRHIPAPASFVALVALLAGAWAATYAGGGTSTAWPHLFYIPIVLATLPFGIKGGLLAALASAILCGPLMPLDVATGQSQALANWLTRGVFFVSIGAVSGTSIWSVHRQFEKMLTEQFEQELQPGPVRPSGSSAGSRKEPRDNSGVTDINWSQLIDQATHGHNVAVVFQPMYRLNGGGLHAIEALTRFASTPSFPPNIWFDQAADRGQGLELERTTLTMALAEASRTAPDSTLSLNVSPQLLNEPWLIDTISAAQQPIILEVTEHAVVDDYRTLAAIRRQLRDLGVELAVDDAGAGFASLRHIVRLDPDVIKLDMSLTRNIANDPIRRPLADALVHFAQRTDAKVVAEGIEHADDLEAWTDIGAHSAQGYLLARPGSLPVDNPSQLIAGRT